MQIYDCHWLAKAIGRDAFHHLEMVGVIAVTLCDKAIKLMDHDNNYSLFIYYHFFSFREHV